MRLRPPAPDDLEPVFEVIAARDLADLQRVDYTLEDLRDAWRLSELDLAADVQVVEDPAGRLIAYGIVEKQGSFVAIRPEDERSEAGGLLLDWSEQRERELGHAVHKQVVARTNRPARELLESRGYALARSNVRMAVSLDRAWPDQVPPGVALRPLELADAEAMNVLDNRAFASDPGYVPESLTTFREEHFQGHDSAPELSLAACEADRIVGFMLARRWADEGTGYIDVLAVDPDRQGQGIGRALLHRAFSGFAAAGLREAQLSVSSVNPRALRLYESAGMKARFRHDIYERPVAARSS